MTLVDGLTVGALLAGPIAAVFISNLTSERAQSRYRRGDILRRVLAGRLNPADPTFSVGIGLVPLEFHSSTAVMEAWRNFVHAANTNGAVQARLEDLVVTMMQDLGYRGTDAGDVVRNGYGAQAYHDMTSINAKVQESLGKLGAASERSANAAEEMLKKMP